MAPKVRSNLATKSGWLAFLLNANKEESPDVNTIADPSIARPRSGPITEIQPHEIADGHPNSATFGHLKLPHLN
jgi:hypothetical protein